ncbi:MAG TPA: PVC-type heme-binding CxxCH protein [Pirellulales bacterium]|nr:PVC-type heme-binding CxxCH protein [Pirellulales bacterium]
MRLMLVSLGIAFWLPAIMVRADPPKSLDADLVIELVAREPEIVTPVGLVVDGENRIWAIENHTHQTTPEYQGPKSDRVRVFEDLDERGRARKVTTFAEGFRNAMNLAFGPDGSLYLATRSEIRIIADPHGKPVGGPPLLKLDTKGDYPHDGLGGLAFARSGEMYVGMGENLGVDYKLIGSDGTTLAGKGEGGNVFACRADGGGLRRVATGFWNPFHLAFDAAGQLFAVDNDPDARGPCRLLHVVEGGDYGYRFRYGRKGLHPFDSWNGDLPGTLPMVAGTGEAPSGIIAYQGAGLPEKYRGSLLTTSWGDHVIECFQLVPRGASFQATAQTIVRGGEDFRPVGIAAGPDGALYITDWVDRSYPVHGKGRIWRLRAKHRGSSDRAVESPPDTIGSAPLAAIQSLKTSPWGPEHAAIAQYLADADPFVRSAAIDCLGRPGAAKLLAPQWTAADPQLRLGALLALRRGGEAQARELLPQFLDDESPAVRRAAIQWIAEEHLETFADALPAAALKSPTTPELFRALLAAQHLLAGGDPGAEPYDEIRLLATLADQRQPAMFRRLALQLLRADHPQLTTELLQTLLHDEDLGLRLEAVRTLAWRSDEASRALLRAATADAKSSDALRSEALLALAGGELTAADREILFAALDEPLLRRDALRTLRAAKGDGAAIERIEQWRRSLTAEDRRDGELAAQALMVLGGVPGGDSETAAAVRRTADARPADEAAWRSWLAGEGDAEAGRRVFFHPQGPRCYACHQIEGRGGAIGPELSTIGRARPAEHLITSILKPSQEIAPRFATWSIIASDGRQFAGMIVDEDFSGRVTLADAQARLTVVPQQIIDQREPQTNSIMPDKLPEQMTPQEFRDLLAFLRSIR